MEDEVTKSEGFALRRVNILATDDEIAKTRTGKAAPRIFSISAAT